MGKIDLHIHSSVSDGRFSPEEIVHKAAGLGMAVIALADHDSVDGIAPALLAARNFPQLSIIPSVEISTDTPDSEVHLLGYFIDYTDEELKATLERFRSSRQRRAQKMVARLGDLGIHISWSRVQEIAGSGSIGRPHVAQAMLEKGYIVSLREAFDKYIGRGGPAYVEREKMTPLEAVELIMQSDGLSVLAHPFTVINPESMIIKLKEVGLIGIEVYYNNYTNDQVKYLVNLADKHNLIASGGSDYHGLDNSSETMIGGVDIPNEALERFIELARFRELKSAKALIF